MTVSYIEALVAGLTEQGAGQAVLRVPASFQGKPVGAIRADAFKDAARAEEIHIPESVEALPEGLLSSCPALRRLVLAHRSAPCGLSAHSLDGMPDLQILVPAEAYAWYRDGYGCAENPWQPYLQQIVSY